jgi:hypothetical protein
MRSWREVARVSSARRLLFMRGARLVGVAIVAPWLVLASVVPACGGKVGGDGSSSSGSSTGDVGGSSSGVASSSSGASGSGSGSGGAASGSGSGGASDAGAVDATVDGGDAASFPGYSLGPDCHPAQVPGCSSTSLAFACAGDGGTFSSYVPQPTLCRDPPQYDPSTGETLYCCLLQCGPDPTVSCDPGTDGYTCMGGSLPSPEPGFVCSAPLPQPNGNRAYCCARLGHGSTCKPDASIQGCLHPSVGFACSGSDAPDQEDPALICSASVIDPKSGDALYCCQ